MNEGGLKSIARPRTSLVGVVCSFVLLLGGLAAPPPAQTVARASAVPAARAASNVAIITIQGPIDRVTAYSVKRRLKLAHEAGADAVVFEIDTPGGEMGACLEICAEIKRSPIPNTVAWVNNDAYSAGALIALACREIIVSESATMGDALPISVSVLGMINELAESERQKALQPLLSEVTDSARRNGYDEKLVQGIVSRGVELWLIERIDDPSQRLFIDRREYVALFGAEPDATLTPEVAAAAPGGKAAPASPPDAQGRRQPAEPVLPAPEWANQGVPEPKAETDFSPASPMITQSTADAVSIAQELPGRRPILSRPEHKGKWRLVKFVSNGHGLITLKADQMVEFRLAAAKMGSEARIKNEFFGAQNVVRLDANWSETLVRFLTNPLVRGLLIVIFLVGLFVEMTNPGLIAPGAIAAAALVALIVPPALVNLAAWWEIAAILIGLVCLGLELFVLPGTGLLAVMGVVLLFGGLVGTFVGSGGGLFPGSPRPSEDLTYGVVILLLSGLTAGGLIYMLSRQFGSLPILNKLVLQDAQPRMTMLEAMAAGATGAPVAEGESGVAATPLRPAGRVQFGDRMIDVVSGGGFLDAGTRVVVTAADEFRVVVEPVAESTGMEA